MTAKTKGEEIYHSLFGNSLLFFFIVLAGFFFSHQAEIVRKQKRGKPLTDNMSANHIILKIHRELFLVKSKYLFLK